MNYDLLCRSYFVCVFKYFWIAKTNYDGTSNFFLFCALCWSVKSLIEYVFNPFKSLTTSACRCDLYFFHQAALKHADSQAVIEKLEQDIARLKLKHSLEIKVICYVLSNSFKICTKHMLKQLICWFLCV